MTRERKRKLNTAEQERLFEARKRTKRGHGSQADHDVCIDAYDRDPEAYSDVENRLLDWLKTADWWELL